MKVEEIPADETLEMSITWHRAFNAAGCNPQCHCCRQYIPIGGLFKLATVNETPNVYGWGLEAGIKLLLGKVKQINWGGRQRLHTKEVMLCDICTPEAYKERQIKIMEGQITERDKPKGGCFRINGKIVH